MFKHTVKEEYKVPASIDHLGKMRDFVTRTGRKYGVPDRMINAFKLAIDEAGTNIIRHAYRDWEGSITIRMIIRETSVTVCLIDQGHTFDPRSVRDPDLQRYVDIGKKGGLGIFIIRRVIDEIDYRKTPEGNELRLTKNRPASVRRRAFFSELSLSMKTRFSLIASSIMTVIAILIFFLVYIGQGDRLLNTQIDLSRDIAQGMVKSCVDYLRSDMPWELTSLAAQSKKTYSPLVAEILVLNNEGIIQGTSRTDIIFQPYQIPQEAKEISKDVYLHAMQKDGKSMPIYDLVQPVTESIEDQKIQHGTIHLILDKSTIDREIAVLRRRSLGVFGISLLLGYAGVFLLIYLTMSPFKKLAGWIRDIGQDEVTNEMEFNTSDEIGEIARAFNEITEKFRKSQENLAEQERLQKEMQVAQEIQHTLLPAAFPDIEGYELASFYEAAKEVGGDYFDFVEVDKDTLGIVVADVSGKGVPGSLVMTMIRTALRTEARGNKNAADVLARVNDFVINDMKKGMFVTVFYVILDSHSRTISYASAGHNPMILYRAKTKKSYYLNPRGFPIGINLPDNSLFRRSIESDTLRLREGDVLICYTDGVTEAMNTKRERFGEERFLEVIRKYGNEKVDPLIDKVRDEITTFTEGFAQSDDITLVAIKEKMKAEDVLFNLRTRLMHLVNEEKMTVKEACRVVGVSTSTFYKYKKRFEKMGEEGLREKTIRSEIEEKHIAIEDKVKIYDIIKNNPDFGPKRISEELNTEKYGFTEIDERRIYEELTKSHLNNKELREAFVERGGRGKRLKPPGTPFLSLDGQVIVEDRVKKIPFMYTKKEEMEQPRLELRVSQKTEEEISQEKEEPSAILDDFLGINEEETGQEEKLHLEEIVSLGEEDKLPEMMESGVLDEKMVAPEEAEGTALEKAFEDEEFLMDLTEEHEPGLGEEGAPAPSMPEKKPAKGTRDSDIPAEPVAETEANEDEQFDNLVVDTEHLLESDEEETGEEDISLEKILEEDEGGISSIAGGDQIEDRIASSIAGELIEEETDETDREEMREGEGEETSEDGEAFLKMMENLGFDRRSVFSQMKKTSGRISKDKKYDFPEGRFLNSGLWFYKQGVYNKAILEFQKAIQENGEFAAAYQCLGDTYFRMGRLDEAKKAYERVREIEPSNINVLENLGVIFANRGDYKKAVWQWGEVLKRNPDRKDIIDRIKKMQRVIRQRYQ